jgi:hypothetical protein
VSPYVAANLSDPNGGRNMISESRKAIVAFLLAFLGPVGVLLASDVALDWRNVLSAFVAGLIVGLGTYVVPNAPKPVDPGNGQ